MKAGEIPGATIRLGAPNDWNEERDGTCGVLAVKQCQSEDGMRWMESQWDLDEVDRAKIAAGAPIVLTVFGGGHPPVMLKVGEKLPPSPHSSHDLRYSDASSFDYVCNHCGRTDITGGGWGRLREPCPQSSAPPVPA